MLNRHLEKSTPASRKAPNCHPHSSASTLLICRDRQSQSKRVCYADDITVWATGVKIPDLEDSVNSYLEEIIAYLKDNALLISAPKSTVTLFSPDPHQAKTHPRILIEDSQLPLDQYPNILGVYLDTSLSFKRHSGYVAERVSSRNNILKALTGSSWGQQKETLLMTYRQLGDRSSTMMYLVGVRDTNYRNIQYTQNEALRIATGCHKMSSVDHLHGEAKMLKVREHSELLSAQYLARCLPLQHHKGNPQETDKGDTLHQTSQHCRTNDVSE